MILPNKAGVYTIINLVNGERYIGATTDIARRWQWHRNRLRCGKSGIPKLQAAWDEYSEEMFRAFVLEVVANPTELSARETHYITTLKPQYNMRNGSNISKTPSQRKRTPEQIARIRAAKANVSPETRAKMSAAKQGKAPMVATRAAAEKTRGTKRSPEVIEKIRAAQRERWARKKDELLANAKRDAQGKFTE